MELRQLVYLDAVVREGGFGRAAALLHVAQPAVSVQIRKLETELGTTLLARTTRHVGLTHAGELFLARARRALAELDGGARRPRPPVGRRHRPRAHRRDTSPRPVRPRRCARRVPRPPPRRRARPALRRRAGAARRPRPRPHRPRAGPCARGAPARCRRRAVVHRRARAGDRARPPDGATRVALDRGRAARRRRSSACPRAPGCARSSTGTPPRRTSPRTSRSRRRACRGCATSLRTGSASALVARSVAEAPGPPVVVHAVAPEPIQRPVALMHRPPLAPAAAACRAFLLDGPA